MSTSMFVSSFFLPSTRHHIWSCFQAYTERCLHKVWDRCSLRGDALRADCSPSFQCCRLATDQPSSWRLVESSGRVKLNSWRFFLWCNCSIKRESTSWAAQQSLLFSYYLLSSSACGCMCMTLRCSNLICTGFSKLSSLVKYSFYTEKSQQNKKKNIWFLSR